MADGGCTVTTPLYDATSCADYTGNTALQKSEGDIQSYAKASRDTTTISVSETEESENYVCGPGDEPIRGWLLFFLIFPVGLTSVINFFYTIDKTNFAQYGDNWWIPGVDIAYSTFLMIVGIFTVISFFRKKPDAVFLARSFIILHFIPTIGSLIITYGNTTSDGVIRMLKSLVWCFVWFLFTFGSGRIEEIFPKEYRKTFIHDYILIGAAILVPVIMFCIGIASAKSTELESQDVAQMVLDSNQYTDGRIVLTIPDGSNCEERLIGEDSKLYTIIDSVTGSKTQIMSDYDIELSEAQVSILWQFWKPKDLDNYHYEVVTEDRKDVDGKTFYSKKIRVGLEKPFDWEFTLVSDSKTGNTCLLSCFSLPQVKSPTEFIIKNLRFL